LRCTFVEPEIAQGKSTSPFEAGSRRPMSGRGITIAARSLVSAA
jgi:hypothetical protein